MLVILMACYSPAADLDRVHEAICEVSVRCSDSPDYTVNECMDEAFYPAPDGWCDRVDRGALNDCLDHLETQACDGPPDAPCDMETLCAEGYNPDA